jgi:hypothetical protein
MARPHEGGAQPHCRPPPAARSGLGLGGQGMAVCRREVVHVRAWSLVCGVVG